MLVESRRLSRALQAPRDLAECIEASRPAKLRSYVERELTDLLGAIQSVSQAGVTRIGAMETSVRTAVAEGVNSLSASLGEVEDTLDRSSTAR